MVLAAARCGLGVALVPKVLTLGDLAEGRLCRVSDRELPGPSHYALIYPARSRANPAFAVFREWIDAAQKEEPASAEEPG